MQEKKTQTPTQNIHMVRAELRKEDPSMNFVTMSGVATGKDKWKKSDVDLWILKAPKKKDEFNLQREKYTFVEAKKGFP